MSKATMELPTSPNRVDWESMSTASWSGRDGMGAVAFGDRLWVVGGFAPGRPSDVWSTADGQTWDQVMAEAPWPARNLAGCVGFNQRIWLLAGLNKPADRRVRALADVWSSEEGKHWESVNHQSPWGQRGAPGVVAFNGRLWILGGMDPSRDYLHFADVWSSPNGRDWDRVCDAAPWGARSMFGCVVHAGRIWVIGGGVYHEQKPFHTVADYGDVWSSTDGRNWDPVVDLAPFGARRFHAVAVFDNRIWVAGGYHRGNLADVWSSADGRGWQCETTSAPWPARHAPALMPFQNALWLLGGYGARLHNDVWRSAFP